MKNSGIAIKTNQVIAPLLELDRMTSFQPCHKKVPHNSKNLIRLKKRC